MSRIDPATDRVTDAVPAGREPGALTIAGGALWIADATEGILRLDPRIREITETVPTGSSPAGLATVDGDVWATAVAAPAAHRGGTLRVGIPPVPLDPALGGYYTDAMQVISLAYEGLLRYRRAAGTAGSTLVGALAADVPRGADGGRRYVFRLRPGVRFSDGTLARPSDFRSSIERVAVIGGAEVRALYGAIAGVARCRAAPSRCDLSRGIVANDRTGTVTIRLRRSDPDLLQKLALPIAAVVPASTPRRPFGTRAAAGTGPYRIERLDPGHRVLLARNPEFRPRGPDGPMAGFADRIDVTLGKERARLAATERGGLDVTDLFEIATARTLKAVRTRVGTRLQSASRAFTEFAWLNVEVPPFDDVAVRRAINFAVDRRLAVDLTGGPAAGSPTCQLVPAGLAGYRPTCSFTVAPSPAGSWTAPDLGRARRLVAASGTRGAVVDVATYTERRSLGRYLTRLLNDLGYRARLHVYNTLSDTYPSAFAARRPAQIGINGWLADFPEPAGFLRALVGCKSYVPGEPFGSSNVSRFCDPGLDAAIDRAQAAGASAGDAWLRIERRIAAQAPIVPLVDRRKVVVTSPRAGNLQIHLLTGPLLEQVWVR